MEWGAFPICWFMGGLVCKEIVFPGLLSRRSLLSPQCQVFGVSVCFSKLISYKVQLSSWQLKSLDQGHSWVTAGARKRICLLTSNQIVFLWPHASIPHVKSPLPPSLPWDGIWLYGSSCLKLLLQPPECQEDVCVPLCLAIIFNFPPWSCQLPVGFAKMLLLGKFLLLM